jgi:hypothetical protein
VNEHEHEPEQERSLLEAQEHKGYGEDEGEREAALDALAGEEEGEASAD